MIPLRLLNLQGITGLAASVCLALLLLLQRGETRHWRKQSGQYEQLYRGEEAARTATVAGYRAAADLARAADKANADRVVAEQRVINERTSNDLEARLADARARYDRLRGENSIAATDPGRRASTTVPGLPHAARVAAETSGQDRLPGADALIATEQAIQLDELINWVRAQAKVDNNGSADASPGSD